jgi:hypothetical protein
MQPWNCSQLRKGIFFPNGVCLGWWVLLIELGAIGLSSITFRQLYRWDRGRSVLAVPVGQQTIIARDNPRGQRCACPTALTVRLPYARSGGQ